MGAVRCAIGLMSGTSMDGIDVAMLETDGEEHIERFVSLTVPYPDDMRRRLSVAIAEAAKLTDRAARPGALQAIEHDLTDLNARAVEQFISEVVPSRRDRIELIGYHGQTVLHRPEQGLTIQLGDGERLAKRLDLPVIYDLRQADMDAGGQGAPLAPVYHRALAASQTERPVAVLNIGGVANVTFVGRDGDLIAFDTGPGNALLDDWMAKSIGAARDEGGAAALAGTADTHVVSFFMDHDYFKAPPPKSLDRNTFFWDLVTGLSPADGAATLVAITAASIAQARDHLPEAPAKWIVAGGGRHNRAIMAALSDQLGVPVIIAEDAGFDGDAVEAEAWAYLAVRSDRGLPLTFPGTTGVARAITGGKRAG
ncbi:MAG: anhydro-N-acetylmuramic acid kinase [Pseudomonadota bacterium]